MVKTIFKTRIRRIRRICRTRRTWRIQRIGQIWRIQWIHRIWRILILSAFRSPSLILERGLLLLLLLVAFSCLTEK